MGELLPAIIQETSKGLRVLMGDLVGADVAALGETFVADIAREGLFTCMAALMRLFFLLESIYYEAKRMWTKHTLRLPSCEKRCPHDGSLQI